MPSAATSPPGRAIEHWPVVVCDFGSTPAWARDPFFLKGTTPAVSDELADPARQAQVQSSNAYKQGLRYKEGLEVAKYHGRLGAKLRRDTQERFMAGDLRAIVATNAFGMGIDKPDIRFVVHYDMPGSLEAYYQESGRAGRDGATADCLLLYRVEDRRTHQYFMGGRYPGADDILGVRDALARLGGDGDAIPLAAVQEEAIKVGKARLRSVLAVMKEIGVVRELRGSRFRLIDKDLDAARLDEIGREYQQRREDDRRKLERMTMYAQSAGCRWKLLLEYFGEGAGFERCGTCDNCVDPPERKYHPPVSAAQPL